MGVFGAPDGTSVKRILVLGLLVTLAIAVAVVSGVRKRAPVAGHSGVPLDTQAKTSSRIPPDAAIPAWELTAGESAELTNKFEREFRPAFEKWCMAYEWHVPISPPDFTVRSFRTRLGDFSYIFDVDGYRLSFYEKNGVATLDYFSAPEAMELNRLPPDGTSPDVTVPVRAEDMIRMAKSDMGSEFKTNDVIIRPTGAACALMGGAFVEFLPAGADPENFLSYKLIVVFGPKGVLLDYQRNLF
jgi:hypothetical protein